MIGLATSIVAAAAGLWSWGVPGGIPGTPAAAGSMDKEPASLAIPAMVLRSATKASVPYDPRPAR